MTGMIKVQKRDGRIVEYDREKIVTAIGKANAEVEASEQAGEEMIDGILDFVESHAEDVINVETIQDMIESGLVNRNKYTLSKKYIIYRYQRALLRKANTTDESILKLIKNENKELAEENSNKNTILASTQRDYIAGEVSRDLTKRMLLPERISLAHEQGAIHFHDADYFVQPIFNCCLINIGDMLDNGTVMNEKMIESPKSFQVACTVMTQIIAAVASNQYGGQSVDIRHLGKYLRKSNVKFHNQIHEEFGDTVTPKLIYVLDENNCLKGGKYDYITKLAVKCSSKRMYPDYISAKKMRENYEGNVFSCMGCRSFLSTWKDENGNYKFEGRFNQGVVSLNLPQIGILAKGDEDTFWKLLDERLNLCYEALMCRHKSLEGTLSDVSPIHWQYGAIARLKKGEKIDPLLRNGYSTISLGYIGLYEMTKLMKGVSHTTPEGEEFALRVMNHMRKTVDQWKNQTGLGFGLYGTPAESLCYRFAKIDRERFGIIPDVTDKGYYTNSYHVDVRESIDAFSKFNFESQFQKISSGGAISYVEVPNMQHNLEAMEEVVRFIYDNIQYAEFNTKSDYCQECGFDGEIIINDDMEWECPQCHNKDKKRMNVTRRTCGYLGENFWNTGKTKEIKSRVLHL